VYCIVPLLFSLSFERCTRGQDPSNCTCSTGQYSAVRNIHTAVHSSYFIPFLKVIRCSYVFIIWLVVTDCSIRLLAFHICSAESDSKCKLCVEVQCRAMQKHYFLLLKSFLQNKTLELFLPQRNRFSVKYNACISRKGNGVKRSH
jgi:hypothetical protein